MHKRETKNPSIFIFTGESFWKKKTMLWIVNLSWFFFAIMFMILMFPSILVQSPHPAAEAIRSSSYLNIDHRFSFRQAPPFNNALQCDFILNDEISVCDPVLIHIAITLDIDYLRGSIAAVHSILHHALCPETILFHFIVSDTNIESLVQSIFPQLKFKIYYFNPNIVKNLISTSVRQALEQPLNYARNYLADLLENCVNRVIYLDSDLVVVDDISELWNIPLGFRTIGAPEYCHANFTKYFTASFWSEPRYTATFRNTNACYFNTGVMVIDLVKWRKEGYTKKIEKWMEIQNSERIYELGSLPPFLLVFAGHVAAIEHRWNQHGLGGDNVRGNCRELHPGPVSLLHWSGSGKPWLRLDSKRPCPLDSLWAPFDLFGIEETTHESLS